MNYYITTFCYGDKYSPIEKKWMKRIEEKCPKSNIIIYKDKNIYQLCFLGYNSYV